MIGIHLIAAGALFLSGAAGPAALSEQLEAAIYAEEQRGDLSDALARYRQILTDFGESRAIAAQAQGRLAACLLRMGQAEEAQAAYQQLVENFGSAGAVLGETDALFAAYYPEKATADAYNRWIYFDPRESAGGPRLVLTVAGSPDPVELEAVADTLVIQYLSDRILGAHPQLSVSQPDHNRVLIRFDLPANLKAGDVTGAALRLTAHPSSIPVTDPFCVAVFAVDEPWEESTTHWMNQPRIRPEEEASFAVVLGDSEAAEQRVDVTALVQAWLRGDTPDNGLSLRVCSPIYGPQPLDLRDQREPFPEGWTAEMDVDGLWRRMVYGEIGQPQMAGLWALIKKGREGDADTRNAIVTRALATLTNRETEGYERWLSAFLLSGIQGADSVPALLNALDDPTSGVRTGVWMALGAAGAPASQLEAALARETSERVLVAAKEAMAGAWQWRLEPDPEGPGEQAPQDSGWVLAGNAANQYKMTLAERSGGTRAFTLAARVENVDENRFGTMLREMDAAPYRGKRLRLTANVKAEGVADWAGLWMRIDGADGKPAGFDNMQNRPISGSTDRAAYQVVLDVPEQGEKITYGILLRGAGSVTLSEPVLDVVGEDTPVTALK